MSEMTASDREMPSTHVRNNLSSGDVVPNRGRLATDVRSDDFKVDTVEAEDIVINVPLRAKVEALWALVTMKIFSVGDDPLADLKQQTNELNTNIGLLSALLLTIVMPLMFDSAAGPQTNAYINTSPMWVGEVYFVMIAMATITLMLTTLSSVFAMLVLNECTSAAECRFLISSARTEFLYPVRALILSFLLMTGAVGLWLIIVLFTLHLHNEADTDHALDRNYTPSFFVTIVGSGVVGTHYGYVQIMMAAKLFKTSSKFKAEKTGVHSSQGNSSHVSLVLDVDIKHMWEMLHAFLDDVGPAAADPDMFKEYLFLKTPGPTKYGLSYRTEKLAETMFEKKMSQLLKQDHENLLKQLDGNAQGIWEKYQGMNINFE